MYPINSSLPDSCVPKALPVHEYLFSAGEVALGLLIGIPVGIMKAIGKVVAFVVGKEAELSKDLRNTVRKMEAVFLNLISGGAIFYYHSRNASLSCTCKNIAKLHVIGQEKDLKKSREFLGMVMDPAYCKAKGVEVLSDEDRAEIAKKAVKGARTKGICFGASLMVVKKLLSSQIQSEEELVKALEVYRDGFPAKAAALQSVALALFRPLGWGTAMKTRVASLIGMCYKEKAANKGKYSFSEIAHEQSVKERFNQVKNSYYLMSFNVGKSSGHSVVYIKKEFGSYIYDPNFGLISCGANPAEKLCELFKESYPGCPRENKPADHSMRLFKYVLAP